MRIAITINTSWNIFNFRSGMVKAFINSGHEVIAIAPADDFSQKLIEMGCTYVPISMDNTGGNPIADFVLFRSLKKTYKQWQPDIVLQYTIKPNIYGTLAASRLGIPVINNVSGLGTVFLANGFSSIIAKWLYRLSFNKANLVFFQNPNDRLDFLSHLKLKNLNTDLLPGSGINLDHYRPVPMPSEKKFVFLLIARLIIEKGIAEYVEAARIVLEKHADVEFHILGQLDETHARGITQTALEHWVNSGLVKYLGTSSDVRVEIGKANCVVLPSYREGTPKTLLEACALARPIITTDVPGCREVVADERNGYLCKVRDAVDLSEKMFKMLRIERNELEQMGAKGRRLVEEKFSETFVINRYLEQINKIMNNSTV